MEIERYCSGSPVDNLFRAILCRLKGVSWFVDILLMCADEGDDKCFTEVIKKSKSSGRATIGFVYNFIERVFVLQFFGLRLLPLIFGTYRQMGYSPLKGCTGVVVIAVNRVLNIFSSAG